MRQREYEAIQADIMHEYEAAACEARMKRDQDLAALERVKARCKATDANVAKAKTTTPTTEETPK